MVKFVDAETYNRITQFTRENIIVCSTGWNDEVVKSKERLYVCMECLKILKNDDVIEHVMEHLEGCK